MTELPPNLPPNLPRPLNWYAVQCKPRQDARAEEQLANQGFEVFRPLGVVHGRRRSRIESFFPGYLFIRLGEGIHSFATVRSTRGVLKLVGWGSTMACVPQPLIDQLRSRTDAQGVVRLEATRFKEGQSVRIADGPFRDLVGTFQGLGGKERVVVMLTLLNQQQRLKVRAQDIEAV